MKLWERIGRALGLYKCQQCATPIDEAYGFCSDECYTENRTRFVW